MPYGPARGCDAVMNAWCDANCVHAHEHGPLLARIDVSSAGGPAAWRCYAPGTLSADSLRYQSGDRYCTRHPQLIEVLDGCQRAAGNADLPAGGARVEGRPCEDDMPECSIWSHYDQCSRNELWMTQHCAKSCGTCGARADRAGPSGQTPARTPPAFPPPGPPTHESAPPRTEVLGHQPTVAAAPNCQSACGGALGGPTRAADRCSGRGACVPHRSYEWCECEHTLAERRVGLRCERAIGVGQPCAPGCANHGYCVNGYCECEHGWHGVACELRGLASPLLTQRKLLDAGLGADRAGTGSHEAVAGGTGLGSAAPAWSESGVCYAPSIHHAFARPAVDLDKLMRSLPPSAPPLGCGSCAVVSNAGSLLDREYGEHIDSNECVFRLNRAPTAGFERHVGARTTLDYLNSFPHVRGLEILPRVETMIVHGMAVELWRPAAAGLGRPAGRVGFDEYMAWVDGHVQVTQRYPQLDAHVVDLAWMQESWEVRTTVPVGRMGFRGKATRGGSDAGIVGDGRTAVKRAY